MGCLQVGITVGNGRYVETRAGLQWETRAGLQWETRASLQWEHMKIESHYSLCKLVMIIATLHVGAMHGARECSVHAVNLCYLASVVT